MILNLKSFWLQARLRYFFVENLSKELQNETLNYEKRLQFFLFVLEIYVEGHPSLREEAECRVKMDESFSRKI